MDNGNNKNIENSEDELDALINSESKFPALKTENILKPTTPLYTETNKLPNKEPLNNLASPALRLAANIVDIIYFLLLVILPYYFITFIAIFTFLPQIHIPVNEINSSLIDSPLIYAIGALPSLYVILQFLAYKKGTTLGHKYFKLYIINNESGELAKFWRVFLRELPSKYIIYIIPYVGQIYLLIDNYFIFKYEKKTLHDRIAKTSVIKLPGSNKRNITVLSIILGFTALIFIPVLLSSTMNVENDLEKEMSYQEALAFTREVTVVAAFTLQLDAQEQAIKVAEGLSSGSYSSGIFTSSYGISYQIYFAGDTVTLGDIYEGEIPPPNSTQVGNNDSKIGENNQSLDSNTQLAYQEATDFANEIKLLANATAADDAEAQAHAALENIGKGSYYTNEIFMSEYSPTGIFTSSNGISYEINFSQETARVGDIFEGEIPIPNSIQEPAEDIKAKRQALLTSETIYKILDNTYTKMLQENNGFIIKANAVLDPDATIEEYKEALQIVDKIYHDYGYNFSQVSVTLLEKYEPTLNYSKDSSMPSDQFNSNTVSINVNKSNTEFVAAIRGAKIDDNYYNCWFLKYSSNHSEESFPYTFSVEKRTKNNCTASTPPNDVPFTSTVFPLAQ